MIPHSRRGKGLDRWGGPAQLNAVEGIDQDWFSKGGGLDDNLLIADDVKSVMLQATNIRYIW